MVEFETAAESLLSMDERQQSVVISDPSRPDNPLIFVSEEFTRQTGYAPSEALGRNCRFLQGPDTAPDARRAIRQAVARGEQITVDILNYRKDGVPFWNRLRIRPLYDARGIIRYFAGVQNPIPQEEVRRFPANRILD